MSVFVIRQKSAWLEISADPYKPCSHDSRWNPDRGFLRKAHGEMRESWVLMERQATERAKPMKPRLVAWELGRRLADTAVVSSGCGTIATCVKYRLLVKVVIIKNNRLGMIKWERMVFLENPKYRCDLQAVDCAGSARACGGTGFTIEDPAE